MLRAGCQDGGRMDAHCYTINDIVRTFGISRTTIMYYESLGIVVPQREGEQARRVYSDSDVYRLMSAVTLKNVGIPPKDLPSYLEDRPFTTARCDEYAHLVERDIEYRQAVLERMRLYGRLCANVGGVALVDVPAYYIRFDAADTSYKVFPEDETLDLLIAHMPIGGLGSRRGPVASETAGVLGSENRWGRTVPVRYAHLIEGLQVDGLETIGGCTCVCAIIEMEDIRDAGGVSYEGRSAIETYIERHDLVVVGDTFCPLSLPSEHGFIFPVCVPVRPSGQA